MSLSLDYLNTLKSNPNPNPNPELGHPVRINSNRKSGTVVDAQRVDERKNKKENDT